MVIKQGMLTSNKIGVLGLDFLEGFPICQYWTKHLGIALGIYVLGMPSFRQNKINIPASSDLVLLVPKLSDFIFSLQQIPDPVHSHNSVLTAVSLTSLNLHYCPIISCKKKLPPLLWHHISLIALTLHGVVFWNVFTKKGTVEHSVSTLNIFL